MQIQIEDHSLSQSNLFVADYMANKQSAFDFFHYNPDDPESYKQRYAELMHRSFPRQQLADVIERFLSRWSISAEQRVQLERLRRENSVVVIGGQQAGLLTGPLYTLYKVITIINRAKLEEERLAVPVIPVFWIAGEDHDFEEINHVYMPHPQAKKMRKITLQANESVTRQSISQRLLPKSEIETWLDEVYSHWKETDFSAEVKRLISHAVEHSTTYVDFFASLLQALFARYGLLLVDSADPELRQLETEPFKAIIRQYQEIDTAVRSDLKRMQQAGYTPQLQLGDWPALLFIHHQEERLLLEAREGLFRSKDGRLTFTEEELLHIAEESPGRLSNNVITRPYMQERLFPTLCFVAGPGEIAYWGLLSTCFEQLGLKLPIIIPRLQITLIEPHIGKLLTKHHLDVNTVVQSFDHYRQEWLAQQDKLNLDEHFQHVKDEIAALYQPLIKKIGLINKGLIDLGQKNLNKLHEQVNYLHKRAVADFKMQHEATLRQFDKIEQALHPEGKWQERVYNPFYYFNKYGLQLLEVLMQAPYDYNGNHKLVFLNP